jgi:hypothetical protein
MKTSCKILILICIVLISSQSYAQKIGIQGGINLSNMLDKDNEATYSKDYDYNLGFNGGVTFELGLGNLLALQVGALIDSKGFKITSGADNMKAKLLYADVPVLLKIGPSFGPVKVFGAAGPYIGTGLTGKVTMKISGHSQSQDVKWGSGQDNDIKRIDYGLKFGVGAEVMKFSLGAYYALGMANLAPVTDNGTKMQNRVLSISLGYRF